MAVLSRFKKSPDTSHFDKAKLQEIAGYVSSSMQTSVYPEKLSDFLAKILLAKQKLSKGIVFHIFLSSNGQKMDS